MAGHRRSGSANGRTLGAIAVARSTRAGQRGAGLIARRPDLNPLACQRSLGETARERVGQVLAGHPDARVHGDDASGPTITRLRSISVTGGRSSASRETRSKASRSGPAESTMGVAVHVRQESPDCRPGCSALVLARDDVQTTPWTSGTVYETEPPCWQARDNRNPAAMRLLRRARCVQAVALFLRS